MRYISLDSIKTEDLLGTWQVENRFNNNEANIVFGNNYYLIFESNQYISRNGIEVKGKWALTKLDEFIYNPQVEFYLETEKIGNAIITRYLELTEENLPVKRLTLYFNSGLELILKK